MNLKKLIAGTCTSALLLTSVSSFAQISQRKMEVLNSQFSQLHEAHAKAKGVMVNANYDIRGLSKAIMENQISEQELLEYIKVDMSDEEQFAFDLKVMKLKSNLEDVSDKEELKRIISLALQDMNTGSNFIPFKDCSTNAWIITVAVTISAIAGISYLGNKNNQEDQENIIDDLNYEIQDIEGTINTLKADGLTEDSYFITALRADQNLLQTDISISNGKIDDLESSAKTLGIVSLSGLSVSLLYGVYMNYCR